MAAWSNWLASHGFIVINIDTNSTSDQPAVRATALYGALETLRQENTRSGSPLQGHVRTTHMGVLGWSIVQIGIFGIVAAFTGAIGAWLGGRADQAFGPKPVVSVSIIILTLCCIVVDPKDVAISIEGIAVGLVRNGKSW